MSIMPPALQTLGSRIAIIGPSNSGKSTLAAALAAKLDLPAFHLDQHAHIPGTAWTRRPDIDFVNDHDQIITGEQWVMDGNYSVCMPARFARATSIIWLDPSPWSTMAHYIWRHLTKGPLTNRPGQLQNSDPTLSWKLIRFTLLQYPKNRLKYQHLLKGYAVIDTHNWHDLQHLYTSWGLSR